jgi:hypothetical protein
MSTTTTNTSRATSRTSATGASLAASSKFKSFATVFSISAPVVYCLVVFFNYPLATYFPGDNRWAWGAQASRAGEGPNMLWYGFTATAVIIAAILGIIAMMLPERTIKKIPLSLLWILPILAIPYVIYSLNAWWKLAFALQ